MHSKRKQLCSRVSPRTLRASRTMRSIHAQQASDATHSLPWSVAAVIPWLGSPFETGQQISDVVLGLAGDVLKPAAEAGTALSPDRLIEGSRVDVQLLRDEEPKLSKLSEAATSLNADAQAISDPRFVSLLADARSQLQDQTAEITGLLENTALAARLAPPMMGADGPRSYFMAFQTNAEARGTGGLLGGFGVLRFDNGTGTVDTLGANTELDKPFTPIDLGSEFEADVRIRQPVRRFPQQQPEFTLPLRSPDLEVHVGTADRDERRRGHRDRSVRPQLHARRRRTRHHARRRADHQGQCRRTDRVDGLHAASRTTRPHASSICRTSPARSSRR